MTTTTYILIYCYPLASQHLVRQDVPTERFQNRQLCTWCPRFELHNLQHGMLLGPWSSQTGISHSITLQNLRGLAPLQHPPWLWLPGLSQTLFQMKNCSKTTCFSSRATTFATSSSTVFAMAASLAPPAMEQSDGVCTSWCNLSSSDWVCLILRVCHSGLLWILESQKREIDPQSSSFSTILVSKCAVVPSRRTLPFRGNSQMISEHMIPRPKAKIARERAKCLFDGRHLCFADDTILASVFWLLFLGSSFWVDWLASNGRLERLQIYNLFVGFLPIHLPLFQSLLASRALKTWHHSGVDESKKEACCQCYLPTCYGLHNPPLPHAPDIKLSTMTPWITTTLAPIFTRYNWYNLLLSLFHEFPLLKPHQEAGRLASLPPTPPVHCTMWRCA